MGIADFLKKQDAAVSRRQAGKLDYFNLSPSRVALRRVLESAAAEYAFGVCLDAGAGWQAHAVLLEPYVTRYLALDRDPGRGRSDCYGSVLDIPLADASVDTVYCSQVLEHVTDDRRLFTEFFRVLRPGGVLILSVPHLAYLHNEPHDYRRLTRHGLHDLGERAGFDVVSIQPAGGLISFLAHPFFLVFKALFEPIPYVREIVGVVNAGLSSSIAALDRAVDRPKRYALNEVLVARRPLVE